MRNSKSLLTLGALLVSVSVCLWLFWLPGGSRAADLEGPLSPTSEDAQRPGEIGPPVLAGSNRKGEEELPPPDADRGPDGDGQDAAEEESKTGVLFGNIVDTHGTRLSHGRAFLLAKRDDPQPLLVLELEGPNMQFRCELPAREDYWLFVDPESLGGAYIPALSRSRRKGTAPAIGESAPLELKHYARHYVYLKGGEVLRQDLTVGAPAQAAGRLLDWDGTPIPGVLVRLSATDKVLIGLSEDSLTDEAGFFTFGEVFPGGHRLVFSRDVPWSPPLPRDVMIEGGASHDFGDIYAGGGQKTIRGLVLDQDGEPFGGLQVLCFSSQPTADGVPPHTMSSALSRATTDASGRFELHGLHAATVKVSLTSSYEPRLVQGSGNPAIWEEPLDVDLTASLNSVDVGTHTVHESRPFTISGRIAFDPGWLAKGTGQKRDLQGDVSQVKDQSLPEGIRRASVRRKRIDMDLGAGSGNDPGNDRYHCQVETPMTEIEIRFKLKGHEDLIYIIQPEALGEWNREIRVPLDFGG